MSIVNFCASPDSTSVFVTHPYSCPRNMYFHFHFHLYFNSFCTSIFCSRRLSLICGIVVLLLWLLWLLFVLKFFRLSVSGEWVLLSNSFLIWAAGLGTHIDLHISSLPLVGVQRMQLLHLGIRGGRGGILAGAHHAHVNLGRGRGVDAVGHLGRTGTGPGSVRSPTAGATEFQVPVIVASPAAAAEGERVGEQALCVHGKRE